jgi:pimeloyl-ACP methyl ester carboxylesterase/ketosteroid isomerase-like protein
MNARSASLLALLAVTAISAAVEAQTTPVAAPPGSEGNLPAGNVLQGIAGASAVREGEVETADGVRLYYRVEGEGRDTVVVLHGGPSLGHAYLAPDLVPLARGRAVVHYDQRGIGRSTPLTDPERLSVERHVEDLEALRTHLWPEAEAPGSRPASEAPSGAAGFDTVHVAAPTGEREADREELEALTARFVRALNDESWRLLAPFYAPDAILKRPGGAVLEGREAILDYFRPIVARIRGVEAISSRTEEDERGVTVTTAYTARFAPAPDPVPATFSNTWARQPDGSWLIVTGTFEPPGDAKAESHGTIRSGYFHSEGVRLHYLDFGGEGMPVLFISSGDRTAYAFMEFAPRFTDRNRVLALSQRGAGPSEGDPAPIVGRDVLGRDIIALLDALGIERAVVAHMWEDVLVYLAEEHPERMAGLVFLEGFPPRGIRTEDPLGIFAMLARNRAAMWGADPEAGDTSDYVPRFLTSGEAVGVPSLLFVDERRTGESEWEQLVEFARLAGRNPVLFPDAVARTYFERLAADEEMQERGRTFWHEVVEPVQRAAEEAFHRAFGGSLRTVPVEGRAIGYGYRDAPDVIYPHIRQFLRDRTTIAAEPFHERDGVFAFTDVAVVDVASGGLLRGQTVVVAGNRISHVGPAGSVAIPAGARVVAAGGKYLVPGLWDMHVHSSSDRITRETFLPLYLANGVTGVRDMAADCFAPCHELESSFEHVLHWRREIAAGTLVGPRVVAASPMILSPPRGEPSSMERPATAAEARALVPDEGARRGPAETVYAALARGVLRARR